MTKEEAIKLLLESKDNTIERSLREWEEWDKKYFEAIDMAIIALLDQKFLHRCPCQSCIAEQLCGRRANDEHTN